MSPDGTTIVFVGYTPDGFDLFTMPYPAPALSRASQHVEAQSRAGGFPVQQVLEIPSAPYSPLATLAPTSWSPVIEGSSDQIRIGAGLAGFDVLGYHAYAASATWSVSTPAGAPEPSRAQPDWQAYYAYARWRPTLFLAASMQTTFFGGPPTAAGTPTASTLREREVDAGVLFPIQHVRTAHQALLSIVRAVDEYTLPSEIVSRDRTAARAAWQTVSAKTYGYSVSAEDGVAAGTTAEFVRRGLGSFADSTTLTADARAYLPGLAAHHVIALRAAAGTSTGDATAGRTFLLGGPGPNASVTNFGSSSMSLLRGFPTNSFAGRHAALVNAEYRFPIARPRRGVGTWPLLLHTIQGAIVADAGDTWTTAFSAASLKTSAGAELSARIVAGYYFPFTATLGAAWGHDRSGRLSDRATVYVRIGRAF